MMTAQELANNVYGDLDVRFIRNHTLRNARYKDVIEFCHNYCADYAPDGASKQLIGRAAVILADMLK